MFDLRYYQTEATAAVRTAWDTHQSTAVIAATGSGKTEVYMALAVSEPGRVLVLVHRDYLIRQPVARLDAVGFDDIAVEKAHERAEVGFRKAKIVFASVSSIGPTARADRLATFDPFDFSLVIVDEAHRGTATTYRRVLDHFKTNPKVKILVLTATPKRKDGVGLKAICDSVAYTYGPSSAMSEGWIVPVKFWRREVESLDFSGVRMKGSDLDPVQVQQLLMQEKPLHEVCASLANDQGPTLIFCPEVAVGHAYEAMMNERYRPGRAKMLHADSPDEEREDTGKKLANGDLDYLFNVGLFTEGYDLPRLERVVWAAPTASLVRYTQGVGRVFRCHPDVKPELTGDRDDSERRRAAIRASLKPFGTVVTFYPQNCRHELCDPIDILGGDDLPPDLKAAARQVQDETSKQAGGSTTETDIETAKVFGAMADAIDHRRRELKAQAHYSDHEFDPMSGRRQHAGSHTPSAQRSPQAVAASWGGGNPASDKQVGWLTWKGLSRDVAEGFTKYRAMLVRNLYELGVPLELGVTMNKGWAIKEEAKRKAEKGVS